MTRTLISTGLGGDRKMRRGYNQGYKGSLLQREGAVFKVLART